MVILAMVMVTAMLNYRYVAFIRYTLYIGVITSGTILPSYENGRDSKTATDREWPRFKDSD